MTKYSSSNISCQNISLQHIPPPSTRGTHLLAPPPGCHFHHLHLHLHLHLHHFQVVTFITGKKRRSFDHLQATHLLGNFADHQPTNLLESFLVDSLASGSLLNQLNLLEDELPSPGCTPRLAVCLSKTLASQLAVEEEEVKDILERRGNIELDTLQTGLGSELVESLAEWASSGSVEKTWRSKLGKRPLSSNVVHCFSKYNTCLL